MKCKILKKDKEQKEFKPFSVKLKIETIEEARTLFHVFNCGDLREEFPKSIFYELRDYSKEVAKEIRGSFWKEIKKEIKYQGFEI